MSSSVGAGYIDGPWEVDDGDEDDPAEVGVFGAPPFDETPWAYGEG